MSENRPQIARNDQVMTGNASPPTDTIHSTTVAPDPDDPAVLRVRFMP